MHRHNIISMQLFLGESILVTYNSSQYRQKALGKRRCNTQEFWTGDFSEDVTPVPIPNTTVKGLSGDDTAYLNAGK